MLACEPFLLNGLRPLWHLGGGHGEVGGGEMELKQTTGVGRQEHTSSAKVITSSQNLRDKRAQAKDNSIQRLCS
jgi:hypothetical protein